MRRQTWQSSAGTSEPLGGSGERAVAVLSALSVSLLKAESVSK